MKNKQIITIIYITIIVSYMLQNNTILQQTGGFVKITNEAGTEW